MESGNKIEKIYAILICTLLTFAFVLVGLRIVVKNVLYDRLGMTNAFVEFCIKDDDVMGSQQEQLQEKKASVDWAGSFPFDEDVSFGSSVRRGRIISRIDRYRDKIDDIEDKIDMYTNFLLIGRNDIVKVNERIKDLSGWKLYSDAILMDNGYAVGMSSSLDDMTVKDIADSVKDLNDYCERLNIPLLYMHLPGKVNPDDGMVACGRLDHSNQNANALLEQLKISGVDIMDCRDDIRESDRDWYSYFYKTDGHWNTEVQLYMSQRLAARLDDDYGFEYDTSVFDISAYDITTYDSCWGGKGRVMEYRVGQDDFALIEPAYDTEFTFISPIRAIEASGSYAEVFIPADTTDKDNDDLKGRMNYYNAINIVNDPFEQIINNNPTDNRDKKILMISDSFTWFMSSYLACDTGEIDRIYVPEFGGSIRNFISQNRPDIVIIAYNIGQAKEESESGYRSTFDFR